MIFRVPDDDGYGYDDYGVGKALTREYIASQVGQFQLAEFYPRTPSVRGIGSPTRMRCLRTNPSLIDALTGVSLLRRWQV